MYTKNRKQTFFYNMRRFHNNIKRHLLNKFARNADYLLDLACGKGGDLQKWNDLYIKNVDGYDINNESIIEAKRRYRQQKFKTNVTFTVMDLSKHILVPKTVDWSNVEYYKNKNINNDLQLQYDVVTSMFAFHYFFESPDTFDTVMTTITNNLKNNGIFIGTFFDGESLKNDLVYNEHFKITFQNENGVKVPLTTKDVYIEDDDINEIITYDNSPFDSNAFFGRKISVMMKDTVLNESTDEYIVDFDSFVERLRKLGFELIETELFKDLDYSNYNLNDTEKEVSFLNRYFVFRYVRT